MLDVEGDPAVTGKAAGADALRGKPTYPAVAGHRRGPRARERARGQGIAALAGFGPEAGQLRDSPANSLPAAAESARASRRRSDRPPVN